jgi:fumarylacetoacetate (FAA) hydrolase
MRLVTVSQQNNKPYIAAVFYDRFVTQLTGALGEESHLRTMVDFIRSGSNMWNESYARAKIPTDTAVMLKKCKLHAPITPRSLRDFYAFEEHVKTSYANRGREVPPEWYETPVFYYGNTTTIYGTEEIIPYPSKTTALDYELEIACVIGKEGRDIPVDKAEEYIFGYMIFNDWSARDLQKQEMAVGLGPAKGKDFASSFGPYLVTSDELAEYHAGRPGVYDLKMIARVNDKEYSRGNMKDMHFSFGELIARASQDVTLYPGDVIASGTVGTGCLLELTKGEGPWLQPGDVVELEIEHLGILRNIVGDRHGTGTFPRQTAEQVGVLLVTPVLDVAQTQFEPATPVGMPTPAAPTEAAPRTTLPATAPLTPPAPPAPASPTTENLAQTVPPSPDISNTSPIGETPASVPAIPTAPDVPPTQPSRPAQPEDASAEGLTTLGGAPQPTSQPPATPAATTNTSAPLPPDTKPFDKSVVQSALDRAASENNAPSAASTTQPQPEVENTTPATQPPVVGIIEGAAASGDTPASETLVSPTSPGIPDASVAGELVEAEAKTPAPIPSTTSTASGDDNHKEPTND